MKKAKLLFIFTLGSLLLSCGETTSSSLSIESSNTSSVSSTLEESNTSSNTSSSLEEPNTSSSITSNTSSSSEESKLTLEELENVAKSAVNKANSIASGVVTLEETNSYSDPSIKEMPFEFGKDKNGDVLHFVDYDWSNNPFDMYLMEDDTHSIVAVKKDNEGNISKPYDQYDKVQMIYQNLLGYEEDTLYGTEGLLNGLINYLKKNVNKDAEYKFEDDQYKFSFGYFSSLDTYQYYVLNASFSLGVNNEIVSFDIDIFCYNQTSFIVDDELQVIQLLDNVSPSSTKKYKITQATGERTFINPISLDSFYATNFDLIYDQKIIHENDVISLEKESNASINIANVAPSTANFDFDSIKTSIIEGNAGAINVNYYSNQISIYGSEIGTFKIQIASKNVTKTFQVEITAAQPNSISLSYSVLGPEGYTAYTYQGAIQAYVGVEYILNAMVEPTAANQTIIANVDGLKSDYELVEKEIKINEWVDSRNLWCFTPKKAGTYDVVLKSAVKGSVQKTVHIVVEEVPSLNTILKDEFALKQGSTIKYYVSFEPSNDNLSGNVKIVNRINNKEEILSYTIAVEDTFYSFNLTHVSGDEFNLNFKLSFDFTLFLYEDGFGNQMSKVTPEFLISGSWEGTSGDYIISLSLFETKEVSFSINKNDFSDSKYLSCSFSLKKENDGYLGNLIASENTQDPFIELPLSFNVDKDFTSISISFIYNGTNYSTNLVKADY